MNTKFFHLQACHRKRKNYIPTLVHEGHTFTSEEAKSEAVFDYYNALLGTRFHHSHRIDLERLNLPRLDLQALAEPLGSSWSPRRTVCLAQTGSLADSIGLHGLSSRMIFAMPLTAFGSRTGGASTSSMTCLWFY